MPTHQLHNQCISWRVHTHGVSTCETQRARSCQLLSACCHSRFLHWIVWFGCRPPSGVWGTLWAFTVAQSHQCSLLAPRFWLSVPSGAGWLTFANISPEVVLFQNSVFLSLMSVIISSPKAEQLVKHYIIVRNSCLTWLVIFCLFVPSTFCATASPVLSSHGFLAPQARLWRLIYSGASLFLSHKDLSVSVLVQFSFPGPVGCVWYTYSFFPLFRCLCIFIWLCCSLKYWWVFSDNKIHPNEVYRWLLLPVQGLVALVTAVPSFLVLNSSFCITVSCVPSELNTSAPTAVMR